MQLKVPSSSQPSEDYLAYEGGLDVVTPDMKKPPGRALDVLNWEIPATGGYRVVEGYERFDGRPPPSDATVLVLQATTTFAGTLAAGDSINGQASGATAVVIYINADRKWVGTTKVVGTFTDGENIREGITVVAVKENFNQTIAPDLQNQLVALAATNYRTDITTVPGSGPVRGVWGYNGLKYAIRDNVGATAGVLHKSSASGWAEVALNEEVYFTAGNSSVNVGDTLTQGGVTATIRRVIITSGTSPNLVGKLVISGRAGGNFAAGAATSTGGGVLTLSGAQTAQALPVGGIYEFENINFTGSASTFYMYAASGVGRTFEFDGTYLAFIDTGISPDTPKYLRGHINRLWVSFNSSVQFSGPGEPHQWSAVLGAAELAAGAPITGLVRAPGTDLTSTLFVFTKNYTKAIYGKTTSTFVMDTVLPDTGAHDRTAVNVINTVFLDDTGITNVATSDKFGNFQDAELSALIRPFLLSRIGFTHIAVSIRENSQYKLFFTDGSGVSATFRGGRLVGMMPFQYPHIINCASVVGDEESDFGEVLMGMTNGYVMTLNRGRSFDGEAIGHRLRMAYNFLRSPRIRKRFRRVRLDVNAPGFHTLSVGYIAGRNDPEIDYGTATRTDSVAGGAGGFDDVIGFDEIAFDGDQYATLRFPLDVTATDISFILSGSSDNQLPLTVTGQSLSYVPRRTERK